MSRRGKILVLGSEGFIGSNMVRYFLDKNYEVSGADIIASTTHPISYCSLADGHHSYQSIFSVEQFDVCIHAAGSGNVGLSIENPLLDFESNTAEVLKVLEAIRVHQVYCKFILISSAAVYGNPFSLPISEVDSFRPLSPYAWHKHMAEIICREYTTLYNIPTAITRPFSVFGPGLRKQLFWDLYKKHKESIDVIELWGSGNESRDFIYITDLCYCFELIIEKGSFAAEIYNIGSGIETTVREAATLLFTHLDKEVTICFNNTVNEGNPLNWRADISKIRALGFQPTVTFNEGVKQLSKWLRTQN